MGMMKLESHKTDRSLFSMKCMGDNVFYPSTLNYKILVKSDMRNLRK